MAEIAYLFHKDYLTDASGQKYYASPYLARVQDSAVQARIAALADGWVTNITELQNVPGQISDLAALIAATNLVYSTKAEMDADTAQADGALALVFNDSTGSNNGLYTFAVGSPGSWSATTLQLADAADLAAKMDTTWQMTAAGLVTGGGDGSANRTVTVTEASEVQAEAMTDSATVLTPRRGAALVAQYKTDTLDPLFAQKPDDVTLAARDLARGVSTRGNPYEPLVISRDGYSYLEMDQATGRMIALNAFAFDYHGDLYMIARRGDGDPQMLADPSGYACVGQDRDGLAFLARGPRAIEIGLNDFAPSGGFLPGAVSDVKRMGLWWQYNLDAGGSHGPVRVYDEDEYSGHILDTQQLEALGCDGQSWNVLADYTPADTAYEDTSGETQAALERFSPPDVVMLRRATEAGSGDNTWRVPTISNEVVAGGLHRFRTTDGYAIGPLAAAIRNRHLVRLGGTRRGTIVNVMGWPGQSNEKFLAEGTSYEYGSGPTTVNAALVDGEAEYLWARNLVRQAEIEAIVTDTLRKGRPVYDQWTWIQGSSTNEGQELAFKAEYRSQLDGLDLPLLSAKLHCFHDQRAQNTGDTLMAFGAHEQMEFCQTNTSGYDWLVGPRYPYKMRDNIHHSAMGAWQYAEMMGLAMADVAFYGSHEPLWFEEADIDVTGAVVTITTNTPRNVSGGLVADITTLTERADRGFSVYDVDLTTLITINSVVVSGNTITLNCASTVEGLGSVEIGYAARGTVQTTGTEMAPTHSGCWGNIKMAGTVASRVRPDVMIDFWLCSFRKTLTV